MHKKINMKPSIIKVDFNKLIKLNKIVKYNILL